MVRLFSINKKELDILYSIDFISFPPSFMCMLCASWLCVGRGESVVREGDGEAGWDQL